MIAASPAMQLVNTAALVTGAARRVGRAIALELARGGCDVAVHYRRSRAEAEGVVREIAALGRRGILVDGDLSDERCWPTIVDQAAGELGRLDILINNASEFLTEGDDSVEAFDERLWSRMLRVNLVAPMALCHHARRHLAARGAGRIINLSDISAERPWSSRLAYCVSKAGLDALTRGLARALAPEVLVNAVAPGIAVFPESYSEEQRERIVARVPQRREGSPEELGRFVRAILEHGDYLNGQVIAFDGGRSVV